VAYGALRGEKWLLIVDGAETGSFDFIGESTVRFTPAANAVACLAGFGNRMTVVVGGEVGNDYTLLPRGSRWVLDGPTRFHAIAVRGREFFRMNVEIVPRG
jgi:hypothetical protein